MMSSAGTNGPSRPDCHHGLVTRRILHVCDNVLGGIASFLEALVPRQVAHGHQVTVALPADGPCATRMAEAGASHVPWQAMSRPGLSFPAELASLRSIVAGCRPDVVHLHNDMPGLLGRLVIHGRHPTVFQPHAWSFIAVSPAMRRPALAWEKRAARWTAAIVCVSEAEQQLGTAAGIRAPMHLARNGVDLDLYPPQDDHARRAARTRLGVRPGVPLAVCVGRLHRQKGQHALLDAWPQVRTQVPDAELALVGDGPDRADLEQRLVAGVLIAGRTSDVLGWLAAADLVVLPSRWEGLSLSLLEALACARSVVVTDVPGMGEVVCADVGAVVPCQATSALAGAISVRLLNRALTDREGRAGRALVERRYDVVDQHRKIESIYADVLGACSPRG